MVERQTFNFGSSDTREIPCLDIPSQLVPFLILRVLIPLISMAGTLLACFALALTRSVAQR